MKKCNFLNTFDAIFGIKKYCLNIRIISNVRHINSLLLLILPSAISRTKRIYFILLHTVFITEQIVNIKKKHLKINTEQHRQHFSIMPHSGAAGKNKWTKSHTYYTQQAIPIPTSYATKRTRVGNTANSWKIQRLKAECNRDTGLGCILKQNCTRFGEQKHGYSLYDVALLLSLLLSFVQNASLVYCVTCLSE